MSEIPRLPEGEGYFDVTGEFDSHSLVRAFVEGGIALAKQRDPVAQFQRIVVGRILKIVAEGIEANKQFEEIVRTGHRDVGRYFDMMVGMYIFQVDPNQFFKTVRLHEWNRAFLKSLDKPIKPFIDNEFEIKHFGENFEKENISSFDPEKPNKTKYEFLIGNILGKNSFESNEPKNREFPRFIQVPKDPDKFKQFIEEWLRKIPKKPYFGPENIGKIPEPEPEV